MKHGRSIEELGDIVEAQLAVKEDYITPTGHMHMQGNAHLDLRGVGTMGVTPLGHRQIGVYTGIPAAYYDTMLAGAPNLLAENVNHWFHEKRDEARMVRVLDGNVRALLSNAYRRVDNFDVMKATLEILGQHRGLNIAACECTESRLYIKATDPKIVAKVPGSKRVGDIVEAGFMVTNSEVGLGRVQVRPFWKFLACLNGMVREGGHGWTHVGRRTEASDQIERLLSDETKALDDAALMSMFRDVLKGMLDAARFRERIEQLGQTTARRIEGDPVAAVAEVTRLTSLAKSDRPGILRHLIEGADLSQYGLINAVTRYAEDQPSFDRATEIEAIGGSLADLPAPAWKRIATATDTKGE